MRIEVKFIRVRDKVWHDKTEGGSKKLDIYCFLTLFPWHLVLQEAVSTGDPEMVQLVLQYRDYQRATRRLAGIPELLNKLRRVCINIIFQMNWSIFHSLLGSANIYFEISILWLCQIS